MLPLDDPRWASLAHAYGDARDIPAQLRALARGDDVWRDLWAALVHQGVADTASFAAVPHVAALALGDAPVDRAKCWIFVGGVAGARQPPVPEDLRDAYEQALRAAPDAIVALPATGRPAMELASALAAIGGDVELARRIDEAIDGELWIECPACGHDTMSGPPPAVSRSGRATALAARLTDTATADKIRALDGAVTCVACHHRWDLLGAA